MLHSPDRPDHCAELRNAPGLAAFRYCCLDISVFNIPFNCLGCSQEGYILCYSSICSGAGSFLGSVITLLKEQLMRASQ